AYRKELLSHGMGEAGSWPYTHGRFENGCPIPDVGRMLLNEAQHLMREVQDPFSDRGYERMLALCSVPVSRSLYLHSGITKLAYRIYRLREEVQATMPDVFGADRHRFLEWVVSSAPEEHSLSEPLLAEVRTALKSARSDSGHDEERLPPLCADLLENG